MQRQIFWMVDMDMRTVTDYAVAVGGNRRRPGMAHHENLTMR
jgi:hypothetical protein